MKPEKCLWKLWMLYSVLSLHCGYFCIFTWTICIDKNVSSRSQKKRSMIFSALLFSGVIFLCFSSLLQHPHWQWVYLTRCAQLKQCWNTQPCTSHHKMRTFLMWRCSGCGSSILWPTQCCCTGSLFLQLKRMSYGVMAEKEGIFFLETWFIQ